MIQPELGYLNRIINCLEDRVLAYWKDQCYHNYNYKIRRWPYGREIAIADIAVIPAWVGLEKTVSDFSGHDVDKKQKNMALSQFARRC